jgi:hypothetical protein
MKKILTFLFLCLITGNSFSQNMSGTWGGVFYTPRGNSTTSFFFFLEIQQKARTIWGVYNMTDSNNNKVPDCLISVSGSLSKKPNAIFDLYKEHVEGFDKKRMDYPICNYVNQLNLHYFVLNGIEYLVGKWYADGVKGPGIDGSIGLLVLQHFNANTTRNVDQYFPKLNKMIEKGKSDEPFNIIADDISAATPIEKQLINAILAMNK